MWQVLPCCLVAWLPDVYAIFFCSELVAVLLFSRFAKPTESSQRRTVTYNRNLDEQPLKRDGLLYANHEFLFAETELDPQQAGMLLASWLPMYRHHLRDSAS